MSVINAGAEIRAHVEEEEMLQGNKPSPLRGSVERRARWREMSLFRLLLIVLLLADPAPL